MTFCKIPPSYTSGTGNATVRIIALKNTSTASRSQSFTVTSGTGIKRTITVNQEGAKKDLYLSFPNGTVSTSISVGQKFFMSIDGPDMTYAEFYHELGIVKSVTSNQIVLDLSSLTQSDIDTIYSDLNAGDMIEMSEIFFGTAMDDDPSTNWYPILKNTETSGAAGTYNYTSEYIAESIEQSYKGTSVTLNCTVVVPEKCTLETGNLKIADIEIESPAFESAGTDTLYVYPTLVFSDGSEIRSETLLKLVIVNDSASGELKYVHAPVSFSSPRYITKIRIDVSTSSTPSSSNIAGEMEAISSLAFVNFTNNKTGSSYKATVDDVSGSIMEMVFSTHIPIVKSATNNVISFVGTNYTKITISDIVI